MRTRARTVVLGALATAAREADGAHQWHRWSRWLRDRRLGFLLAHLHDPMPDRPPIAPDR